MGMAMGIVIAMMITYSLSTSRNQANIITLDHIPIQ